MRGKGDVVGMCPTDRRHGFDRIRHASMPTTCGLMTGGSPRKRCTRFEPWKSHRVSRPPNRRRPVGLTRQAKSKRVLNGITVDIKDAIYWDRHMARFGVRVHATGRKVYVVRSRRPASLKRVTLRPCAGITIAQRRWEAAEVIDRIKRRADPMLSTAGSARREVFECGVCGGVDG